MQTTEAVGRDYHVFTSEGRQLLSSIDRSTVLEIGDQRLFGVLQESEDDPKPEVGAVLQARVYGSCPTAKTPLPPPMPVTPK